MQTINKLCTEEQIAKNIKTSKHSLNIFETGNEPGTGR